MRTARAARHEPGPSGRDENRGGGGACGAVSSGGARPTARRPGGTRGPREGAATSREPKRAPGRASRSAHREGRPGGVESGGGGRRVASRRAAGASRREGWPARRVGTGGRRVESRDGGTGRPAAMMPLTHMLDYRAPSGALAITTSKERPERCTRATPRREIECRMVRRGPTVPMRRLTRRVRDRSVGAAAGERRRIMPRSTTADDGPDDTAHGPRPPLLVGRRARPDCAAEP